MIVWIVSTVIVILGLGTIIYGSYLLDRGLNNNSKIANVIFYILVTVSLITTICALIYIVKMIIFG